MTGVCLFVCVVGPGLDSTSPAFVRSRARQAAGSDDRLARKTESSPISGVRDCVDTMCAEVQPRASCVFLDRSLPLTMYVVRGNKMVVLESK